MKIKTQTILIVSKFLALTGGIWYSFLCGSQLFTLIVSLINPPWANHTYKAEPQLLNIHDQHPTFYALAFSILILTSALKALIWYTVFNLLSRLKLQTPFSVEVEKKLERIAYLLFGLWFVTTVFWNTYSYYLLQSTRAVVPKTEEGEGYFFMAAMVYIISQIFKRGLELQEENQLTV